MEEKKVLIAICLIVFMFFTGFISRGLLNRSAIRSLESELTASSDRIGEYQVDLDRISKGLRESEETLEEERDRNLGYIEDIERLQAELTESQRRNREITEGLGAVQEGLGGIAGRANSGSGLIDGCLGILEEARDS